MAQPNFPALAQHLVGAANEITLIPNVPGPNPALLQAIQQQTNQIQAMQQQMQQDMQQMQQGMQQQMQQGMQQMQATILQQMNARFDQADTLHVMRLRNAVSSLDAPVVLPAGVNLPDGNTKRSLLNLTGNECIDLANTLGLPPLPAGSNVQQRRQQIINYLGASMPA